ncbi:MULTISPECIES: hypothetical protein [unclassified Leuconostoc]|uniref:hypothetical protein n=1 Tax=unclassified Leuconostoc TaxID=2685106 RepID=UPI001908460C|nr:MULTISPECIES: hypothetical protein [unclassified Leuconostoc]MBK0040792.1 hypothetical protein [Leuconostoc sp. S51]MBK0051786.1 hypothetical protein [Leuconostoc sp. S50]
MNITLSKTQLISRNNITNQEQVYGTADVLRFKFDSTVHSAQMVEMNVIYVLETMYINDNLYFPSNGAWVSVKNFGSKEAEFIFVFTSTKENHDIAQLTQQLQEAIEHQLVPDWA